MENLEIAETKYTLKVNFNAETGVLGMEGASYPEDTFEFFQPIFSWLKEFISSSPPKIQLDFRINYLNTSSTKCVLDFLELLENYHKQGGRVEVNWYYPEDDEDILETGEELAEDIENPIHFISY